MKGRLLTLVLAVAALVLFYTLFAPRKSPQEPMSRPLSTEAGANGYLALQRWLQSQGMPPLSLRQRYTSLPTSNAGGSGGNLLISTVPHLLAMRSSEQPALHRWIADGNTLLVLAGLADTPEWSMGEGADAQILQHLQTMTGLRFVQASTVQDDDAPATVAEQEPLQQVADSSADNSAGRDRQKRRPTAARDKTKAPASDSAMTGRYATPMRHELIPNGEHPLLRGVHSVTALSEYPSVQFRATAVEVDVVLELARDRAADEPVLWLTQRGQGQIIVCGFGSVFTNKLLAQADNARLLANIVAQSVRGTGKVIIDDAHQGAVSFYDPAAFYADGRLHRSLLWLGALWLVFVLGPQRLRATASSWHPVDITAFIRATGGFLARVVKPAAAAQQLFDNFVADIRAQGHRVCDDEPLWDWLQSHTAVPLHELNQLRDLFRRTQRGQRIDLSRLHNLLSSARRAMR